MATHSDKIGKFIMEKTEKIVHPLSAVKRTFSVFCLVVSAAGCSTNSAESEIPGQLNDGGWVMNVPGKSHTHAVVLTECPDIPVIMTHVHDHDQVGKGPHKHNGCFTCPTPSLASRLYDKK